MCLHSLKVFLETTVANISLKLGQPIVFGKVDSSLIISGQGELIFSKGSVEWRPNGNSVNGYRFTWKEFGAAMKTGTEFRLDKTTPITKKATARKLAGTQAPKKRSSRVAK